MCPLCSPPSAAPVSIIFSSTYLSPTGARSMAIPDRFSAASNPMFDIVVATTVAPASSPRACRSRASSSTASPFTTRPCSSANRHRSASPSNVTPIDAFCCTTSAATTSGCSAPQYSLMFRPVGDACVMTTSPPRSLKSCGATELAAPFAQSITILRLSSVSPGTAASRNRTYSARSASFTRGARSSTTASPLVRSSARKISSSIRSSVASGSL